MIDFDLVRSETRNSGVKTGRKPIFSEEMPWVNHARCDHLARWRSYSRASPTWWPALRIPPSTWTRPAYFSCATPARSAAPACRMGNASPVREAPGAGCVRHGPYLGRPHERHAIWHRGAPCGTGSGGRRPLALMRDSDLISLDVESRRLDLDFAPDELERPRCESPSRMRRRSSTTSFANSPSPISAATTSPMSTPATSATTCSAKPLKSRYTRG
jgi:hypothetical protein